MASPQWNSSPATAVTKTSNGSAINMPSQGSSTPNSATEPTMMSSGFQAMAPMRSPPTTSMSSDLNRMMAPRIAINTPSPNGK
jgi:hypothetical protein